MWRSGRALSGGGAEADPGRRRSLWLIVLATLTGSFSVTAAQPALGVDVATETELRRAWANPRTDSIEITRDISLRACRTGDPIRESPMPVKVDGNGHTVRQTCFEKRLLRQDGTGFVRLENIALQRGGSDGPGAAVTTRGEIEIDRSWISQNLAEEPGGAIFSMRRATVTRSVLTGNLANDDGGAIYARRGGVFVSDSILNGNLVDGSGGAIGSTGDIVVVRSRVDGNTTDGDGGAIYADEDGDVTVVESSVSGSTADGPGGAIFTLDGDVTVVDSVLNGNRADDRGGAISGEADVTVIGSTIARNLASAHVGGGVWSRGNLFVSSSTVSGNSAEGIGAGMFGAGRTAIAYSTISGNVAPLGANISAGGRLDLFGSLLGPSATSSGGAGTTPACGAPEIRSYGYNWAADRSCDLQAAGDVVGGGDPLLDVLAAVGGFGEVHMPLAGSPAIDAIPNASCRFVPFGNRVEGEQHLEALGVDPLAAIIDDQRGAKRPFGVGCDSGAVEAGPTVAVQTPGPRHKLRIPRPLPAPVADRHAPPLRRQSRASGSTTPGETGPVAKSRLATTAAALDRIARHLAGLERSARRYRRWARCVREVPASEYGDHDGRFGYRYDEVDGSGVGVRSALARDRNGRFDYLLLNLPPRRGCHSAAPVPGGTADPARPIANGAKLASGSESSRTGALERTLERLEERADRLQRSAGRFDRWESCLAWIPLTEYGDPEQRFGYEYSDAKAGDYSAAVTVDRSEWDDPDYQLLAFPGRRGRAGKRGCADDPGEAADRIPPSMATRLKRATQGRSNDRIEDLRSDVASLREQVEDLVEPVHEFDEFDECMFTLGMTQYGSRRGSEGYAYVRGERKQRPALAIDVAGFDRAEHYFMAFPGEEPPQIECNEDAGGQFTDE
jgi:predicted outer membrane repeat protein